MDDAESTENETLKMFLKIFIGIVLAGILFLIVIKAKKLLLP